MNSADTYGKNAGDRSILEAGPALYAITTTADAENGIYPNVSLPQTRARSDERDLIETK